MKGEFYKMEWEAWDEGTVDLTLEQEAAYLRFCHQMYRRGGEVPNSKRLLCILWRCHHTKAAALLKALLAAGKISLSSQGLLANKRVTKELEGREMTSRRCREAGEKGGRRSGEARRNLLNGHDVDEASASTVTKQKREEERRREDIERKKEEDTSLTAASSSKNSYAFEHGCIRLTEKDLTKWISAYPHISVPGELIAMEPWLAEQVRQGGKWFVIAANRLSKLERQEVRELAKAAAEGTANGNGGYRDPSEVM